MAESDKYKDRRNESRQKDESRKRQRDGQGEAFGAVLNIWVLGGGLALALSMGIYYLTEEKYVRASYWLAASLVMLVIASLIQVLPYAHKWDGQADEGDDTMRPYVGIDSAVGTFKIDAPISMSVYFSNRGRSPAHRTEARLAVQKIPAGSRIERSYTGKNFENPSIGDIGVDSGGEIFWSGHYVWTLTELMQVATDRSHKIVAHGSIRYRSKYIPSGVDETLFCYELDPETGSMAACRQDTLPENEGQQ